MSRFPLAAACLCLGATFALAHEPEPGSYLSLALDPRVQAEIALSDGQKAVTASLRDEDEKNPAAAEMKLLASLEGPQAKRLGELRLQVRGGAAIADEAVAAELKLTAEQKERVERVWKDKVLDLRMLEKVARFRNAAVRSAWLLRNRREQGDDLIALLTEEQKKAFQAMKGRPFEFGGKK